jgi:predicted nucleic acid-binding protein
MKKIEALIANMHSKRVYFDTNAIIYFVEQNERFYGVVLEIFKLIGNDDIFALTSEFTLTEILIKPIREKRMKLIQNIKDLLLDKSFFTLTKTSERLFLNAAEIGAENGLRPADAIQLASAIESHCHYFVTNDARFKSTKSIEIACLSQYL